MSEEYRVGFKEALRVLRRDVDAHPGWGAGDIYERIVELQDEGPRTVNSNRAALYQLDERTEDRIKHLEAAEVELRSYAQGVPTITQLKAWEARLAAVENRPCTPERVMERVAYLEGQEKLTQDVLNEHQQRLDNQRERADLHHDRLKALETHPERLGSSEKHIDARVSEVERLCREGVDIDQKQLAEHAARLAGLERRQRVDAAAVTNLDGRTRSLEANVADHEQKLGALELVVGSPDAPNRALTSIVSRVEQLEQNNSSDVESIAEHSRKLGLIADVLTGKL